MIKENIMRNSFNYKLLVNMNVVMCTKRESESVRVTRKKSSSRV